MKLVGMLDSPYVRRVAIALERYGVEFEHQPLSVFGDFDAFARINPVVKAPSLELDDGTLLLDSTLILDYFEAIADEAHKLLPRDNAQLAAALRMTGFALAASEKAVQYVYEHKLRPTEKRHQPWVERVTRQLAAACAALNGLLAGNAYPATKVISQPEITSAVAWTFIQSMIPEVINAADYPHLNALTQWAETTAAFRKYPFA